MARQTTSLRTRRPPPGARISLAGAVGAAAAVTLDLSTYSRGRSSEALGDPPHRPTDHNATRDLFALLKPQRYRSSPAWRWAQALGRCPPHIDHSSSAPRVRPSASA